MSIFNEESAHTMTVPGDTQARCSECDWVGELRDCPLEEEQDGWEMPSYNISVCPLCGGCVDI